MAMAIAARRRACPAASVSLRSPGRSLLPPPIGIESAIAAALTPGVAAILDSIASNACRRWSGLSYFFAGRSALIVRR